MTNSNTDIADIVYQISNLEDRAQNADDRDRFAEASRLRGQARSLLTQLRAMQAAL